MSLIEAYTIKNYVVAELILNNTSDNYKLNREILYQSCAEGDYYFVEWIIKKIDFKKQHLNHALLIAAINSKIDIIETLCKNIDYDINYIKNTIIPNVNRNNSSNSNVEFWLSCRYNLFFGFPFS